MNPHETAQSYNHLAAHWDGEKFNRQNGLAQHRRAIRFAESKGTAIDIGCGSSGRIIDLLLSEGYEVEGLDISPEMLRLAKQRHPDQIFYHADICEWTFPKQYDFISAWDSIWHAPLSYHEPILRKLCDGLNPGGILIFTSGGLDAPDEATNPCLGQALYHAALGIPALLELIPKCDCVCRHLEYDQYPEKHLYLIVQKIGNVMERDRELESIERILGFVIEAEKLKAVLRKTRPVGLDRFENAAEHSWHVCLCALMLKDHANDPINIDRVLKMLLIHDLCEIDAGDTLVYASDTAEVKAKERAGVKRVLGMLPEVQAARYICLWDEFEEGVTADAVYARAIDRLPPLLHNLHGHGHSWREHGISLDQILSVNSRIGKGSETLWARMKDKIEAAVSNGLLDMNGKVVP